MILRQSTQIKVRVGPFVDATDGVTPETGVTLGAADQAEALKANGAATVDISAATWAAVTGSDGWYDLTLTTSHTDTVGELRIIVQDSSVCLPVFQSFQVVEEAIYDALYAASATGIPTAAAIRAEVDSNSTQLAAIVADTNELQADWTNGGRLDLIIDAVLADTNAILTDTGTTLPATLAGLATSAALATVDSNVDAVLVDTGTTLPATLATIAGYLDTEVAAILEDTGTTIPALIAALNNISVADVLTTQMTESYAADGTAPTLTQAIMLIQQMLAEKAIVSTTQTVKKLDGSTTAATFTLDDATSPTSITRTT